LYQSPLSTLSSHKTCELLNNFFPDYMANNVALYIHLLLAIR
jgi:hypothetical protein